MLYIILHIQNHDNMIINVVIPLYEIHINECTWIYEKFYILEVIMHDKVADVTYSACSDLMSLREFKCENSIDLFLSGFENFVI